MVHGHKNRKKALNLCISLNVDLRWSFTLNKSALPLTWGFICRGWRYLVVKRVKSDMPSVQIKIGDLYLPTFEDEDVPEDVTSLRVPQVNALSCNPKAHCRRAEAANQNQTKKSDEFFLKMTLCIPHLWSCPWILPWKLLTFRVKTPSNFPLSPLSRCYDDVHISWWLSYHNSTFNLSWYCCGMSNMSSFRKRRLASVYQHSSSC